jgi:hypothetical protein
LQLPFLVTYGAVAWKVAAGIVALLGLLLVRAARTSGQQKRARAQVGKYFESVTAPVLAQSEGLATISGTLHGNASTLYVGDRAHVDRAHELWLDYKGERVELVGRVRVVHGTFATVSRRLPANTPRAIIESIASEADGGSRVSRVLRRAAGGNPHRLAQVGQGDGIIVRGVLGRRGSVDRLGVRSWLLDPDPDRGEIAIVAILPRAPAMPLRWYSALVLAAILAAAACGAMYELGTRALAKGKAEPTSTLGSWNSLSLAAAAPGTRAAALDELVRRFPDLREPIDRVR